MPAIERHCHASRRRPHPSVVVRTMAALVLLLSAAAASADVKVEKRPATVEYKTFDPASPPAGMPAVAAGEHGVTVWELPCDVNFMAEATQRVMPNDKSFVTYRVRQVAVTLSLKVVVWLPAGAGERLKAHQEGHRQIAERAYETADAQARQAAGKIDGRRVGGEGPSLEVAGKKAADLVSGLNGQLTAAYRDAVIVPTTRVQEIYDDLTAHGAKATPDVVAAVKSAFEQQAIEAKRRPKGSPATAAARPATKPVTATRPATRRAGER